MSSLQTVSAESVKKVSISKDDLDHLDALELDVRNEAEALENLAGALRLAQQRVMLFKNLLRTRCDHPKRFHSEYKWEWDSGYGEQKWLPGLRCSLCGKRNCWPGSSQNWTHDDT